MADKTPIVFTNEETAKGFETSVTEDQTIHIAGQYSGKLSAVPADVAEKMVKRGSNLLKAKEQKPAAAPKGSMPPGS